MATQIYYDRVSFNSYDKAATNTNIYNLFSRYSNKFTYDTDNNLIVYDNRFKFSFSDGGNWNTGYIRIYQMDGTEIAATSTYNYRDSFTTNATIIVTTHSFLFRKDDWTYNQGHGPFWFFIYDKSSTSAYAGFTIQSVNNAIDQANNIVNINTLAPTATYHFQKISSSALISPYIMFSTNCVVSSSGGTFEVFEDFRSCSTIPVLSTISINNKNYFAIGTNVLVEAPAS